MLTLLRLVTLLHYLLSYFCCHVRVCHLIQNNERILMAHSVLTWLLHKIQQLFWSSGRSLIRPLDLTNQSRVGSFLGTGSTCWASVFTMSQTIPQLTPITKNPQCKWVVSMLCFINTNDIALYYSCVRLLFVYHRFPVTWLHIINKWDLYNSISRP